MFLMICFSLLLFSAVGICLFVKGDRRRAVAITALALIVLFGGGYTLHHWDQVMRQIYDKSIRLRESSHPTSTTTSAVTQKPTNRE